MLPKPCGNTEFLLDQRQKAGETRARQPTSLRRRPILVVAIAAVEIRKPLVQLDV